MAPARNIVQLIWDEFVYGGHLLSLGSVSIVFVTSVLLGINVTWDFLLIVYLGTESAYLYNRYKDFKSDFADNPERTSNVKKYVQILPLVVLIFLVIILAILAYHLKIPALIFTIVLFAFGILYSTVFKKLTKKIIGFKDFFVSGMWALLVLFLAVYYSLPITIPLLLMFLFVLLRWIVNTSFCDVKDIESDTREGLLTLAVVVGQEKLLVVLTVVTLVSALPILAGFFLKFLPASSLFLLFSIPYSLYYMEQLRKKKIPASFLYNVIVDGEFLLWSLAVVLGRLLLKV